MIPYLDILYTLRIQKFENIFYFVKVKHIRRRNCTKMSNKYANIQYKYKRTRVKQPSAGSRLDLTEIIAKRFPVRCNKCMITRANSSLAAFYHVSLLPRLTFEVGRISHNTSIFNNTQP